MNQAQLDPLPMASYSGRTLAVILSMHRSGSSVTAQLLHRLGASLGPFELIAPSESNRHGHFEPAPINHFDMQLQARALGFDGDLPQAEPALRALLEADGCWNSEGLVSDADLAHGQDLIRALVDSGPVSVVKDPRFVLLWPYWSRVLGSFPGLRVVLLVLVRSPHEVAMSLFMRGKGVYTYHDALDVTAVNLRQLQEIRRSWPDEQVLVRFDPRLFAGDVQLAAKVCGLKWDDDIFAEVFDRSARHHDPTRVEHEAQRIFDQLSGPGTSAAATDAACSLARDAAVREKLIQAAFQSQLQSAAQQHAAWIELLEQQHTARAELLATRCTKLEQGVGPLAADVCAVGRKCTTLSEFVYEQLGGLMQRHAELQHQYDRLQTHHGILLEQFQHQQLALAALEERWKALESHPLYRAAQRLNSVHHRIRGAHRRSRAA